MAHYEVVLAGPVWLLVAVCLFVVCMFGCIGEFVLVRLCDPLSAWQSIFCLFVCFSLYIRVHCVLLCMQLHVE